MKYCRWGAEKKSQLICMYASIEILLSPFKIATGFTFRAIQLWIFGKIVDDNDEDDDDDTQKKHSSCHDCHFYCFYIVELMYNCIHAYIVPYHTLYDASIRFCFFSLFFWLTLWSHFMPKCLNYKIQRLLLKDECNYTHWKQT